MNFCQSSCEDKTKKKELRDVRLLEATTRRDSKQVSIPHWRESFFNAAISQDFSIHITKIIFKA